MRTSSRKRQSSVNLSKERKDLLSKLLVGDIKKIIEVGVSDWLLELTPVIAELLINKEVLTLVGDRYEQILISSSIGGERRMARCFTGATSAVQEAADKN